jgi:hypothetical protein
MSIIEILHAHVVEKWGEQIDVRLNREAVPHEEIECYSFNAGPHHCARPNPVLISTNDKHVCVHFQAGPVSVYEIVNEREWVTALRHIDWLMKALLKDG